MSYPTSGEEVVTIESLTSAILSKSQELTTYYSAHSITSPTFSPSSVTPVIKDLAYRELRGTLRTLLADLQLLVDGPGEWVRQSLLWPHELGAIQVAVEFNLFDLVPLTDDSISLTELSEKSGLDANRLGRILRSLATRRFFVETGPGWFSHSSFSAAVARDEDIKGMLGMAHDELFQAAAEAGSATRQSPQAAGVRDCGFYKRHGDVMYDYYAKNPDKAARFAKCMAAFSRMEGGVTELVEIFPWGEQIRKGTVVDVGGGNGHLSILLAGVSFFFFFSPKVGGCGDNWLTVTAVSSSQLCGSRLE